MSDIEKRLGDLESLVWDLPNLIDLRLGRVDSSYAEIAGRLSRMDRTISMLQTDMRDLHGGVTRQPMAQDARLASMKARLEAIEGRTESVDGRIEAVGGMLARLRETIEVQLGGVDMRLGGMETTLSAILTKLDQR